MIVLAPSAGDIAKNLASYAMVGHPKVGAEWLFASACISVNFTPFLEIALLLVIPGALVILLAALLLTGRT
jgi:hypothetical protein